MEPPRCEATALTTTAPLWRRPYKPLALACFVTSSTEVSSGSCYCWNIQLGPSFNRLADVLRLCWRILRFSALTSTVPTCRRTSLQRDAISSASRFSAVRLHHDADFKLSFDAQVWFEVSSHDLHCKWGGGKKNNNTLFFIWLLSSFPGKKEEGRVVSLRQSLLTRRDTAEPAVTWIIITVNKYKKKHENKGINLDVVTVQISSLIQQQIWGWVHALNGGWGMKKCSTVIESY